MLWVPIGANFALFELIEREGPYKIMSNIIIPKTDAIFPLGSVDDDQWINPAGLRTFMQQIDAQRTDATTGGVGVARGAVAAYKFGIGAGLDNSEKPLSEENLALVEQRFADNKYVYGAYRQPSWDDYERQVAALSGGGDAFTVGDGRRAISLLMSTLPAGAHIIVTPEELYSGTFKMFMQTLQHSTGLEVTYLDDPTEADLKAAVRDNTVMVFSELYSNPRLTPANLELIAKFAKDHNLLNVIDNTVAPVLARPLANGFDIEIRSLTKYDSSQNDILGGVIIMSDDPDSLVNRKDDLIAALRIKNPDLRSAVESAGLIQYFRNVEGGTMSVDTANLLYDRLTNLPDHLLSVSSNAQDMAEWLSDQKGIGHVYYPGLETHPGHKVATTFARAHGGLVTFAIKGDKRAALEFAVAVENANIRVAGASQKISGSGISYFDSFGGTVPNLVLVPMQTSRYRAMSADGLKAIGMAPGLNRLNVGSGDNVLSKASILKGLEAVFRRESFAVGVDLRAEVSVDPDPLAVGTGERTPDSLS